MTVHLLEELSTPALDALPRDRTVVILTVSPLEEHGPHLPVGVDAFTARHFAETLGEQLVMSRAGWNVVLAPTLHLGTFTFDTVGTINVRQRVVRDVVVDYGDSLARAGFRFIFIANGHGGPGHLVALEEAAAIVSRRRGVTMASLSGHLAWEFLRGRYLEKIEAALGRTLSAEERGAFAEDAHGGWWETSVMLHLGPHLVHESYRDLPPARYALSRRLVPNYPLRNGGAGYVGHPGLADPAFGKAAGEVLLSRGDGAGDGPSRWPPSTAGAAFAILRDAILAHELLAGVWRDHRRPCCRRGLVAVAGVVRICPGRCSRIDRTKGERAVKAYVLIETAAGKTKGVKKALSKVKSARATVAAMDAVTGPYDFIAVVEGNSLDAIGNLVTESIGVIDGVTRTTTCVAVSIG